MSETRSTINIDRPDYSFLEKTEKRLESETPKEIGSTPTERLPKHTIEQTVEVDDSIAFFESGVKQEGIVDMETLLELYDSENSEISKLMSTDTFESIFEEIGDATLITITKHIETERAPETAREAMGYYLGWLRERNTAIEARVNSKTDQENKIKTIRAWAAIRTLAKNEFLEKLNELMKDDPDELQTAVHAIQFFSTAQLLVEADIISANKKSGKSGTGGELMTDPIKAASMSSMAGFLIKGGDTEGKSLRLLEKYLPDTTDYKNEFESIRSGVMGEVYGIEFFRQHLENLDFGEPREFEIRHATHGEDIEGADLIITTRLRGEQIAVLVDIKNGSSPDVIVIEKREGKVGVFDGENAVPPETKGIPQGIIQSVEDTRKSETTFKNLGASIRSALSLRVPPAIWRDKDKDKTAYLSQKLQAQLRYAFA